MNSLVNYGSEDDDSSDERSTTATYGSGKSSIRKYGSSQQVDVDVNYDEVQMSLSEDSGDESRPSRDMSDASGSHERSRDDSSYKDRNDRDRYGTNDRDDDKSRGDRDKYQGRSDREDRNKYSAREDTRSRDDDRMRDREESKSKDDDRRDRYRTDRDDDKPRDRRDDRRGKSRESGRDDRYRDRKDSRRRSRSKDRRSKSPRDKRSRSRSRDRRSRSPRDRRSRSRSPRRDDRFRNDRGGRGGYKRFDRNRQDYIGKMGVASKDNSQEVNQDGNQVGFFMPGLTGKYREQIEKRKLLWQKKETPKPVASVQAPSGSTTRAVKVWESTTFAQDTDGKVANKFKRLMGIKNVAEGGKPATEVLKKQEEMFSSMEQQYEVARTATHTMRGVGLGFSSFQR